MNGLLVRLVLEVAVPSRPEFRERPFVHLLKLRLCWADFDACFDSVGCQWACSIDVPLVVSLLLDFRIAADEVVERLALWLCAIGCKKEVMILEVEADSGQVDLRLDAGLLELLRVTWNASDSIEKASKEGIDSPIPERCKMSGELSVPPLMITCFRALIIFGSWPDGDMDFVGTIWTPTARSPSMMTLSHFELQQRWRFW